VVLKKVVEDHWTDHVRNEEVREKVKEQRNILQTIKRKKSNWIGHILRRNCLLKHVIEGKIKGRKEVTRTQGRRTFRKKRRYWKLKENTRSHFVKNSVCRGYGPVVRQTTK
jgi:hypothetical protein